MGTAGMDRRNGSAAEGMATLRAQLEQALERLSRTIVRHPPRMAEGGEAELSEVAHAQRLARFLGQVAAGWTEAPEEALTSAGAGLGSTVLVEDRDGGDRVRYTLMNGPLLDIDDGQVSLASPMGQALLGARPGDQLTVETPQRTRRLHVLEVRTLEDLIREDVKEAAPV